MSSLGISTDLLLHLGLDLIVAAILIKFIYLRFRPQGDAPFTFAMLNLVTFCLASMLSKVSIDLGVSLGLFAIFGILRYRTRALDIGDLTYVFIMIGVAVINGVAGENASFAELGILNTLILVVAGSLEYTRHRGGRQTLSMRYDRMELLAPERRVELLADLEERLGMSCAEIRVGRVDLLMSTAELVITAKPRG